jgi:hypothetical protein
MSLTLFFKSKNNSLCLKNACLQGHLRVSSQDLLMGQQVRLLLLTPIECHGTESRGNDRSSKRFEYPSGLGTLYLFHQKAVYMTETTFASKIYLAFLARSIHDARGEIIRKARSKQYLEH